jgi:hypothetical protein
VPATPAPTTGPSDAPTASGATGGGTGTPAGPATARDELWVLVVLLVLGFLVAEWLVYHRDAVTRLWRGIRRSGPAPSSPPAGRR